MLEYDLEEPDDVLYRMYHHGYGPTTITLAHRLRLIDQEYGCGRLFAPENTEVIKRFLTTYDIMVEQDEKEMAAAALRMTVRATAGLDD